MSLRLHASFVALAAAIATAPSARAQLDLSVAAHASTLGYGVEGDLLLSSHFGLRAMYNGLLTYSYSQTNSGILYDGKATYKNFPLLLDWYPTAHGTFHLSGGVVFNQNRVDATAVIASGDSVQVNGIYYTQAALGGPMLGTVTYPSYGWYAGFGWGTPLRKGSRIGFVCDIGALFSTPKVKLTAPAGASDPLIQANLDAQSDSTQAALKKYASIYPVISLGFNVKF